MATFNIWAMPASFIDCGTHKMVNVAMGRPAIAERTVECKDVHDLKMCMLAMSWEIQRTKPDQSFSMRQRLVSKRAPAGYRTAFFGMDHDAQEQSL